MDVQLKGRGMRVTSAQRTWAQRRFARLERHSSRVVRVELEVIEEKNPRLDGVKRVDATLAIPRKIFRAHADAPDVQTALDRVARKLDRQLRDHHDRRRARTARGSNRLDSETAVRPKA